MLEQAQNILLSPSAIFPEQLEKQLKTMQNAPIDYADIYLQNAHQELWTVEDSIVKHGSFSIDQGVGVRAVSGDKTGFAYSDQLDIKAISQSAKTALTIAKTSKNGQYALPRSTQKPLTLYTHNSPLKSLGSAQKVSLLQEIDAYCRHLDSRVIQVIASLCGEYDTHLIVASDGTHCADIRPLSRLNITVFIKDGDQQERGSSGFGGRYDYLQLIDQSTWQEHAKKALHSALVNLQAEPAPAGTMDIVLASGWPGVLIHEAVGHGLEGDFNRKGSSAFSKRMGQPVASELCTIVDDATLKDHRGSLNVDDEGVAGQYTTLIENGSLKNYMHDKLSARLMGNEPTGNGRRESYAQIPLPRMTNTYMLPGQDDPAAIINSLDRGIYAVNFDGGQVDITSGKFVFVTNEAYWVEHGKIQYPIKGATLIGDGPSALKRISMVGNDLNLDTGVGVCGKAGQSVPVGVGQPTIRIDQITVGGTKTT